MLVGYWRRWNGTFKAVIIVINYWTRKTILREDRWWFCDLWQKTRSNLLLAVEIVTFKIIYINCFCFSNLHQSQFVELYIEKRCTSSPLNFLKLILFYFLSHLSITRFLCDLKMWKNHSYIFFFGVDIVNRTCQSARIYHC